MKKLPNFFSIILSIALSLIQPFIFISPAYATATTGFLRLDRMATSTATSGTVCMTPQTVGSEAKVVVTFPGTGTQGAASFGVNSTATNWTITTTNLPTGASAWPGIGTASSVSGAAVTFPSTALTAGTQYCFNFASSSTLTTPTSANTNLTGSIQTQTSGSSPVATTNFATSVISNDQIVVTASVPSTFTMTLNGNTAALGSLPTSGAPSTAPITMTVSTNANNGWTGYIKNTNANSTLTSASTGDTSISSGAFATGAGNIHSLSGSAGYGMSATAGSGSPTINTEYAGTSTSFGSLDNTKFEPFASKNTVASANTVTITFGAEAAATTKAGTDYTDTVTISAAGQF